MERENRDWFAANHQRFLHVFFYFYRHSFVTCFRGPWGFNIFVSNKSASKSFVSKFSRTRERGDFLASGRSALDSAVRVAISVMSKGYIMTMLGITLPGKRMRTKY